MHRLPNRFLGERAVVIFGGPSILEHRWDLSRLDPRKYVVFLESKALTPRFLQFGIEPAFFLMFYPEKCKANSFQETIFHSFLCGVDLQDLIRTELHPVLEGMRMHFSEYFEPGKPDVPHKRYRWKPDVFLKDSPFDLLPQLLGTSLITYRKHYREYCAEPQFPQPLYMYDMVPTDGPFSKAAYYQPFLQDGTLALRDFSFTNSAAIALFPLLHYLGFSRVYLIGMDMSMLGSMEYSALYTFKSLHDYGVFFKRARAVFSASFPRSVRQEVKDELRRGVRPRNLRTLFSRPLWRRVFDRDARFMRPLSEIRSLRDVLSCEQNEFVNIFEPFRFALPIKGIRNISFEAFLVE